MRVTIDVTSVNIDVRGMREKIENDNAFWTYAATQWWKLYTPYVPMRDGILFSNVRIRPKEIEHVQPYAHRLYEGDNMHFSKAKHPKASAHWDQKAAPTQLPKLATSLQAYIDAGRLKI